jgi:hypothetical protein
MKLSMKSFAFVATIILGVGYVNAARYWDEAEFQQSLMNAMESSQPINSNTNHLLDTETLNYESNIADVEALLTEIHNLASSSMDGKVEEDLVESMLNDFAIYLTKNIESIGNHVNLSWILGFEDNLGLPIVKPVLNAIGKAIHQSGGLAYVAEIWDSRNSDGLNQGQLLRIWEFIRIVEDDSMDIFRKISPKVFNIALESFIILAVNYIGHLIEFHSTKSPLDQQQSENFKFSDQIRNIADSLLSVAFEGTQDDIKEIESIAMKFAAAICIIKLKLESIESKNIFSNLWNDFPSKSKVRDREEILTKINTYQKKFTRQTEKFHGLEKSIDAHFIPFINSNSTIRLIENFIERIGFELVPFDELSQMIAFVHENILNFDQKKCLFEKIQQKVWFKVYDKPKAFELESPNFINNMIESQIQAFHEQKISFRHFECGIIAVQNTIHSRANEFDQNWVDSLNSKYCSGIEQYWISRMLLKIDSKLESNESYMMRYIRDKIIFWFPEEYECFDPNAKFEPDTDYSEGLKFVSNWITSANSRIRQYSVSERAKLKNVPDWISDQSFGEKVFKELSIVSALDGKYFAELYPQTKALSLASRLIEIRTIFSGNENAYVFTDFMKTHKMVNGSVRFREKLDEFVLWQVNDKRNQSFVQFRNCELLDCTEMKESSLILGFLETHESQIEYVRLIDILKSCIFQGIPLRSELIYIDIRSHPNLVFEIVEFILNQVDLRVLKLEVARSYLRQLFEISSEQNIFPGNLTSLGIDSIGQKIHECIQTYGGGMSIFMDIFIESSGVNVAWKSYFTETLELIPKMMPTKHEDIEFEDSKKVDQSYEGNELKSDPISQIVMSEHDSNESLIEEISEKKNQTPEVLDEIEFSLERDSAEATSESENPSQMNFFGNYFTKILRYFGWI